MIYGCATVALQLPIKPVSAETQQILPEILITEVLVGTKESAKQEFIQLYNRSDNSIDLKAGKWAVQIASTTATDWKTPIRNIQLTGVLSPRSYYLLGSAYSHTTNGNEQIIQYPAKAASYFSPMLTAAEGHIRIIYADQTRPLIVADQLEWAETITASLEDRSLFSLIKDIPIGTSLLRRTAVDETTLLDSDHDSLDFELLSTPIAFYDPTALQPSPEEVHVSPPAPNVPEKLIVPGEPPIEVAMPEITELLPNPAAPFSDSNDEYIELYNPNAEQINIQNYKIQVGTTTLKNYTFPDDTFIPAFSHQVYYSKQTKLSLNNTAGQVRLFDAEGLLVSETAAYAKAADGVAWAYIEGGWQWTALPTPLMTNQYVILLPTLVAATAAKPKALTAKKHAAPKATTTKTKKAVVKKVAQKKKKPATVAKAMLASATKPPDKFIHPTALAAVASLAVVYGAYEYRHDVANKYNQLRRNRAARGAHRRPIARSRSH